MPVSISMISNLSKRAESKIQLANLPVSGRAAIRQWFILLIIIFATWIVIYLPLHYSMKMHPRPDVTWMLEQQNISKLIQPYLSTVLQSPPDCHKDVLLLIIVLSATNNFEQRKAIRDTWGKAGYWIVGVRIIFLVGRSPSWNDTNYQSALASEGQTFGDIVQEDFVDSYNNLTVKSVMMLKWTTRNCRAAKFVMKTDDDMFVHVPNLLKELHSKSQSKNLLLGCLITKAMPVKDWSSKWYVPDEIFRRHLYPDYLSGTGYVMSADTVPILYKTALQAPFFYLEDIFLTGICAEKAGIKRQNSESFKFYKRRNNVCIFRNLVTGHRMTVKELRSMWVKIHNPAIKCMKKTTVNKSSNKSKASEDN